MKKILFIFDWDDTIIPSTYLINILDNNNQSILELLDEYLYKFFNIIKKYGTIMIITNATLQWIYYTLSFMKKTNKLLSPYKIISARDESINTEYTDKVYLWKIKTFNNYKSYINQFDVIINIGDSMNEHNALNYLIKNKYLLPNKLTLSYKFIDAPTYKQLIVQQYKFILYIEKFITNKLYK